MRMSSLLLFMCLYLLFVSSASDIKQITHDDDVLMKYYSDNNTNNDGSIFLQRKAKPDASFKEKIGRGILTDDDSKTKKKFVGGYCPSNVHLKWRQRVSSSVYATPTLVDIHGDGHKEVLVNAFVHAIELLEPETGQPVANGRFPIFHESKLHGSTAVYVNNDDTKINNNRNNNRNNNEKKFIVATYDGEILEFNAMGDVDVKVAQLPRAKVTKDWFKEKETERERKEKEHLEELRRKAKEPMRAPGDWEHSGFDAPSLSGHGREPPPEEISEKSEDSRRRGRKLLAESTLEDIKFTMDDEDGEDSSSTNNDDDEEEEEEGTNVLEEVETEEEEEEEEERNENPRTKRREQRIHRRTRFMFTNYC